MKKLLGVVKTVIVGVIGGAGGAVIDTVAQGRFDEASLTKAAIIGAVGAMSGLWVEKPNVSETKSKEGR